MRCVKLFVGVFIFFAAFSNTVHAAELPVVFSDDFEQGLDRWELLDPASWKLAAEDGNHAFSQHVKKSSYKPPHRSPFHVALVKDAVVGVFDLTARVKSTHKDYAHRDAVLVFGFQNSGQFYYVHFGRKTDPHANQIFVVDNAPRVKISTTTTDGTPWTDDWHTVRVRRTADDGTIEVFFDDMQQAAMTATDKRFESGRVGVGTFDDTADWDDIELRGEIAAPTDR